MDFNPAISAHHLLKQMPESRAPAHPGPAKSWKSVNWILQGGTHVGSFLALIFSRICFCIEMKFARPFGSTGNPASPVDVFVTTIRTNRLARNAMARDVAQQGPRTARRSEQRLSCANLRRARLASRTSRREFTQQLQDTIGCANVHLWWHEFTARNDT